ncbi:MAG: class I SAM-dependent methyltransferase, partial [Gammaproteobacteria bacterium]|nr:class I SAM-dependent methyltransferase [Gammaproteobacteria bacterium]
MEQHSIIGDTEGDTEKVKEFWQDRGNQSDVSDKEVTHHDFWQRHLEIELIKKFLVHSARVLDVGCGNGYTTNHIAPMVREIVGIDFSENMINRAIEEGQKKNILDKESIVFKVANVLDLDPSLFGYFDIVISERCLINLDSWENQKKAISKLASVLKPGGLFIFVEGSKNGRERLNEMRKAVGLEAMPSVWHNVDFEEKATLEFLSKFFEINHRLHLGVYDFISRIFHPLLVAPDEPKYDSHVNEVAAKLAL